MMVGEVAGRFLIHELTHVWQFYHGYWVVLRSFWANVPGKGYHYTLEESDAWDDFNVEQQASIVEHWFTRGMQINDDRFPFIAKIIKPGITGGFWATIRDKLLIEMPLKELRDFDPSLFCFDRASKPDISSVSEDRNVAFPPESTNGCVA